MARSKQSRTDAQPAFILHQYPYRETSRLLDVFSRDHGRVMLVARGAQRPGSQLRAVLLGFQPVVLSWFGAGEVKTLHSAEWQGGVPQLVGLPLLCGFYLNELLLRLLPRDDPHPVLFSAYFEAIRNLACLQQNGAVEPVLRGFERQLLQESGYGMNWQATSDGVAVESGRQYGFLPGTGIVAARNDLPRYDGSALLAFASADFSSEKTLQQGKLLMRQAFAAILGDAPLHTRQLLIDLQKL
ncbi:DNA replication and repair protein RecO [Formivibrio citricus]|uniref:DNA repair protein RecO n=1 Tax=Formivibrio citricus TaxID=83765 RepID=A0A1I4WFY4_9NEIS|nr:DNA repair protein RecO [Formivibrio citricus]SFN12213.1 DNA replication and repair protein RecO [Formivibrio citricus]